MFPNVKLKSWNIENYTKMHNRFIWPIQLTHPLAAIIYCRFTYTWRFTRVPTVIMFTRLFSYLFNVTLYFKLWPQKSTEVTLFKFDEVAYNDSVLSFSIYMYIHCVLNISDLQNQLGSSSHHMSGQHICQVWWRETRGFSL